VLTILINLNKGSVYITLSVITRIFYRGPDDHVTMESQCTKQNIQSTNKNMIRKVTDNHLQLFRYKD